ncbi:MAG TPA: DUF5818 domain-containing protein [Nakamurella sp.]
MQIPDRLWPPGRLFLTLLAGLVLAGCTGAGPAVGLPAMTSTSQPPASIGSSTSNSAPGRSPSVSSPATTASTDSQGVVTMSGVVIEGAQPSCRNLQTDDDGRYTLTGPGTAELTVGDRVTVAGRPRPDLISPCGRVFVVTSIR